VRRLECVQTIEIDRDAYSLVRQNTRHFVVQRSHVYPEVEVVVSEVDGYVVVEKKGIAGDVAAAASAQDA
jgi:5-bromo-4-chloroindolyl phosphate hydrolysis protein